MSLISDLNVLNAQRWKIAQLTRRAEFVHPSFGPVPRILSAQNRYQLIQAQTGVHWTYVACTHYRESNLNFATQLGQGDPLSRVSTHVPKGRGPFQTFEAGAYDALVNCAPYAAKNPLWKQPSFMPGLLTALEMYNGLGYAKRGLPSPYVWSGTDQYKSGKYVADGVFDLNVVDKQLGVAGILICLSEAQPSIFNSTATPAPAIPSKPIPALPRSVQAPSSPVQAPSIPSGPILNKSGEDISEFIREFEAVVHDVLEWLRGY